MERRLAVLRLQVHELVDEHRRDERPGHAVIRGAGLGVLPAFHALRVLRPEVLGQGADAGIEQVFVFENLVVEIVFCGQAERVRLDAHVDVFRHQHDKLILPVALQRADHAENLVVGLALRQALDGFDLRELRLEIQAAQRFEAAQARQRNAFGNRPRVRDERVECTAHLTRVACDLRHPLLVVVEFFERHHRQIDVVFLEAEEAGGVVHEHVGVEHEELADFRHLFGVNAFFA
jgi:hypothetical protein